MFTSELILTATLYNDLMYNGPFHIRDTNDNKWYCTLDIKGRSEKNEFNYQSDNVDLVWVGISHCIHHYLCVHFNLGLPSYYQTTDREIDCVV